MDQASGIPRTNHHLYWNSDLIGKLVIGDLNADTCIGGIYLPDQR